MPARSRWFGIADLALTPTWVIVLIFYVGTLAWTVQLSLTNSRLLPTGTFVGLEQYVTLFSSQRWLVSLVNLAIFGPLFVGGCLLIGFLLAIMLDQKVRFESGFRTLILYPYSMSFIVTGLVWQWMFNPGLGIQETVRSLGWETFVFDWIVRRDMAIFTIVIAGIWHSSGLVMVLMLAGLRGVDADIWKASRIDGIPAWRTYISIILPQLVPMISTATILLMLGVIKSYDLVIALTGGGPGISTEVPAKFAMDYFFDRQNIGLGSAASVVMLVGVLAILAPWYFARSLRKTRN
ncbi:carbohydrate ABC transporter permease [Rhizobium leguminosarum]|uniref:carbohydrate ABC transporter permease n=1 Tax=Rhizobium leguminosarum TaxID=384 RepID=UPI003F9B9DEE